MPNGSTTPDPKFWAKVDKSGECWLWTGALDRHGYGKLGRGGRNLAAHRHALALAGVDVGAGYVDHRCSVRACVRPDHLRVVTRKQNNEHLQGATIRSRSGIRGVYLDRTWNKWTGCVVHNGTKHRAYFDSMADAESWAVAKRLELFTHNDADRAA